MLQNSWQVSLATFYRVAKFSIGTLKRAKFVIVLKQGTSDGNILAEHDL